MGLYHVLLHYCVSTYSKYPYILTTVLFFCLFLCFFSFLFATLCAPLSHCLQTSLTHLTRSASLCVFEELGKVNSDFYISFLPLCRAAWLWKPVYCGRNYSYYTCAHEQKWAAFLLIWTIRLSSSVCFTAMCRGFSLHVEQCLEIWPCALYVLLCSLM